MRLVEVEWEDACYKGGWIDPGNIFNDPKDTVSIISIGYVIKETKKTLNLVMSVSSNDMVGNLLVIPKPWIKKVKKIGRR